MVLLARRPWQSGGFDIIGASAAKNIKVPADSLTAEEEPIA